jgi:hypothetical protein
MCCRVYVSAALACCFVPALLVLFCLAGKQTTFATTYARRLTLEQMLDVTAMAEYQAQQVGRSVDGWVWSTTAATSVLSILACTHGVVFYGVVWCGVRCEVCSVQYAVCTVVHSFPSGGVLMLLWLLPMLSSLISCKRDRESHEHSQAIA